MYLVTSREVITKGAIDYWKTLLLEEVNDWDKLVAAYRKCLTDRKTSRDYQQQLRLKSLKKDQDLHAHALEVMMLVKKACPNDEATQDS